MVHVDNKGIIDGLWRGETRCIGPGTKDADLWILIREELHSVRPEGILVEVEHVKAHRTKKEMQQMSFFERLLAEGREKADELAKEGARVDGGDMAEVRAITIQQQVYAALQYAASFHCLVEEWKDCEELKPKAKRNVDLCGPEEGGKEASDGVVCCSKEVSVYEMRKMLRDMEGTKVVP